MNRYFVLLILLLGWGVATDVQAQGILNEAQLNATGRGGVFTYAQPGDITMTVNLWGNARFPGFYILREGTRLNELLSMAGGTQDAILLENRRRRRTTIQLARLTSPNERTIIYEASYEELTEEAQYPELREGDVVFVEVVERERFSWRDLATIGSFAFSIANVFLNIQRIRDSNN